MEEQHTETGREGGGRNDMLCLLSGDTVGLEFLLPSVRHGQLGFRNGGRASARLGSAVVWNIVEEDEG
ncbi:hypothetical protein BHE74_00014116 [Ensete ventricosum]|nr:hypothetical protein BHE74_00014116 [Ensete ventricosum]